MAFLENYYIEKSTLVKGLQFTRFHRVVFRLCQILGHYNQIKVDSMTKYNNDDLGNGGDDGIRMMRLDLALVHFLSGIVKKCIVKKPSPAPTWLLCAIQTSSTARWFCRIFVKAVDLGSMTQDRIIFLVTVSNNRRSLTYINHTAIVGE